MDYTLDVAVDSYTLDVEINSYGLNIDSTINIIQGEHYSGAYEFVASNEAQTIETAGLVLDEDIIIDPIPSNYGLITWNGSVLTVS